jgi:hypothetical protein
MLPVEYFIFVFSIPARGPGKIVGLTISSLLMVVYLIIAIPEIRSYLKPREVENPRVEKMTDLGDGLGHGRLPILPIVGASLPPSIIVHPSPGDSQLNPTSPRSQNTITHSDALPPIQKSRRPPGRTRRRRWSADFDPMLLGIATFQIIILAYFVGSNETLLRRNPDSSSAASQLGFGQVRALIGLLLGLMKLPKQILALVVVVPAAESVVSAFSGSVTSALLGSVISAYIFGRSLRKKWVSKRGQKGT